MKRSVFLLLSCCLLAIFHNVSCEMEEDTKTCSDTATVDTCLSNDIGCCFLAVQAYDEDTSSMMNKTGCLNYAEVEQEFITDMFSNITYMLEILGKNTTIQFDRSTACQLIAYSHEADAILANQEARAVKFYNTFCQCEGFRSPPSIGEYGQLYQEKNDICMNATDQSLNHSDAATTCKAAGDCCLITVEDKSFNKSYMCMSTDYLSSSLLDLKAITNIQQRLSPSTFCAGAFAYENLMLQQHPDMPRIVDCNCTETCVANTTLGAEDAPCIEQGDDLECQNFDLFPDFCSKKENCCSIHTKIFEKTTSTCSSLPLNFSTITEGQLSTFYNNAIFLNFLDETSYCIYNTITTSINSNYDKTMLSCDCMYQINSHKCFYATTVDSCLKDSGCAWLEVTNTKAGTKIPYCFELQTMLETVSPVNEFLERLNSTDQDLDELNFCSVMMNGIHHYNPDLKIYSCGTYQKLDTCQMSANSFTKSELSNYKDSCLSINNSTKDGQRCCYANMNYNNGNAESCLTPELLLKEMHLFYGTNFSDPNNNSTLFNSTNISTYCMTLKKLALDVPTRILNLCQCYTDESPIMGTTVSEPDESDSTPDNTQTIPTDTSGVSNNGCAGLEDDICVATEGCCHYSIYLTTFEIYEDVCVNRDAYIHYLISDPLVALNKANLTKDTTINENNFCKVIMSEDNAKGTIDSCFCHGQKRKKGSMIMTISLWILAFLILSVFMFQLIEMIKL